MANLVFKNIQKVYSGGIKAVEDFSLEIRDKEFIVLVGPSGCGKSTLLRMVAGLEEISSGELYIGDRLVNEVEPKDRDIAMVFQNYALYPHMSVYDNMAFGLKIRKTSKQEIQSRVGEAAKILELEPYLKRKPKELSGGQRQRVALGRAMVRNPKVFLLDEPLSNLDAKLRVTMRNEIIKLYRQVENTFIYVTHDQVEAMTMGTRIVVMKAGFVQQIDTPQRLYDAPCNRFVGEFIGSPPMNIFPVTLVKKEGGLAAVFGDNQLWVHQTLAEKLEQDFTEKKAYMGIRPEDFSVQEAQTEGAVKIRINRTESMGSEIYLYFSLSSCEQDAVARIAPDHQLSTEEAWLRINTQKLHFFDIETEQSLLNRT